MNGQPSRLLVIDQDVSTMNELSQRLAGSETIRVCGDVRRIEEVWASLQTNKPDIIVVGSLEGIEVGFLCQQIRFYVPQAVCAALWSGQEAKWEPFLRNIGVWLISKPLQLEQLEMLVVQSKAAQEYGIFQQSINGSGIAVQPESQNRQQSPSKKPESKQLITVYGPKGGVGKTFLSRELAVFYALQKNQGQNLKVLAVDFNLDLGTIATSLNLTRTPNIYTWVQTIDQQLAELAQQNRLDPAELDDEDWRHYCSMLTITADELEKYVVTHSESGLDVLTSPREIRQSFEIKDYHIYIILEALKQSHYDVILIDTAPDTTDATIQALFFAERVVMVGNPVVDSIENIHRLLKLLREASYPEERIQVCINRLQRKEMFTLDEIRAYFQLHPSKAIYSIPDDDEVKRSLNTGIPLMMSPGRSSAKDAVERLAKSLLSLDVDEQTAERKKATKKSKSMLAKLFQK